MRTAVVVLFGLLAVMIIGCGGGQPPAADQAAPAVAPAAPAAAPAATPAPAAPAATPAAAPAATQYTCTMHPEVIAAAPGTCPKCNMALVPKQ